MIKRNVLSILCVLITTSYAFAGTVESLSYKKLAVANVTTLYQDPGDSVSVELINVNLSNKSAVTEEYVVTLTNDTEIGSASFNVKIVGDQQGNGGVQVNIKNISGT